MQFTGRILRSSSWKQEILALYHSTKNIESQKLTDKNTIERHNDM